MRSFPHLQKNLQYVFVGRGNNIRTGLIFRSCTSITLCLNSQLFSIRCRRMQAKPLQKRWKLHKFDRKLQMRLCQWFYWQALRNRSDRNNSLFYIIFYRYFLFYIILLLLKTCFLHFSFKFTYYITIHVNKLFTNPLKHQVIT